ncbi:VOC family protein [Chelativorans salis]|uniref:VOC family protein n=1 Tax=Chelativorans salis TaxID=2978478 RepID=A0ABT2LMA9_9HYPH|nr:VOC family protein [Chelativorans sp. EGI FJ00035]MCT7375194.1 VOC family protein [Chelativorans sp. EGI FJ00035]
MNELSFPATAPVSVAEIGLKARDADKLAAFYCDTVGLAELSRRSGTIVLGAGDRPLLTIEEDAAAALDDPREAGLFHTAFLLPARADLARWARRAIERQTPLEGASDHLVSEAVYLSDPEGNGIEIYADRPRESWQWDGSQVAMKTLPLDFQSLLATRGAEGAWQGAPKGTVIGHVHLRVGEPAEAEQWWHEALGLDTMAHYGPSAVFLASGGYHHHIGANNWHSPGAKRRDPGRAGLAWVRMRAVDADEEKALEDPWGTVVRVVPSS